MSILNLLTPLKLRHPKMTKEDSLLLKELKTLNESHKLILECFDNLEGNFNNQKKYLNSIELRIQGIHSKILRRITFLCEKNKDLLIPKPYFDLIYQSKETTRFIDPYTTVAMLPRISLDDLKDVADKLDYCIFEESVFSGKNTARNADFANEMAQIVKDKGYSIYYVSPLANFNFKSFINNNNIYKLKCYWGNHAQTFNTLSLSVNVFKNIYDEIDTLKNSNKEILNIINKEQERINILQKQFTQYADSANQCFRLVKETLDVYTHRLNDENEKQYNKHLSRVIDNNNKYKHCPLTHVTETKWYDVKRDEYISDYDLGEYDSNEMKDVQMRKYSYTINNIMPIPDKPKKLQTLNLSDVNKESAPLPKSEKFKPKLTRSEKVDLKRLIHKELNSSYLMVAIKDGADSFEDKDVIVLSTWGNLSYDALISLS